MRSTINMAEVKNQENEQLQERKLETIFEQNKIKQKQITAKWAKSMRSFFNESELIHTLNLTAKTR